MNARKYNTDPDVLLAEGNTIMSSTDDSKYYFRVFAVNMVLAGFSASTVAKSAGLTKATVTRWVKLVDEQGFTALRATKQSGRPPKLKDEQIQAIDAVLQSDPKDFGYKVWDGPTLSAYILKIYGIQMSVRQCQRMFRNLGFSRI